MLGIGPGHRLPTVLIIDDDMVSREVMATVLTLSGYTVHSAADGAESVAMLDAGTCAPEVILMDTQMPGLSGAALIQQLRARSKAKLYAISGSDAPAAVTAGADGFLLKPLGVEALQRVLEQHAPEQAPLVSPDTPVIRRETLSELRNIMPETAVREIYSSLLADLNKRAFALQKAITQGDVTEVRRLGHAIKGGCGMAGAAEAATLGELLESESNQLDNGPAILRELRTAIGNLQRMLDAEFTGIAN